MYAAYPRAEPDLKVYIVFVLARAAGDRPEVPFSYAEGQAGAFRRSDALDDLWSARDRMSAYGRALLLLALDEAATRVAASSPHGSWARRRRRAT